VLATVVPSQAFFQAPGVVPAGAMVASKVVA
jgi:hypothetical protein